VALALYSDVFWLPSGALAAGTATQVFPVNSNVLATLWMDAAGTIPMLNPTVTSPTGTLTFYATVGQYWVHLDSESFLIDVGMSQEQADLSTGIASGGAVAVNGSNPQAIDVGPLIGYIVDNSSLGPESPMITRLDLPAQTLVLDGPAQTRVITYWMFDVNGNVVQQEAKPTAEQRRTHLPFAGTAYDPLAGSIIDDQVLQVVLPQPVNQMADLMDSLGPFSLTGNLVSPNGANLMINKSAGTVFSRSFNHIVAGVLSDSPHIRSMPARIPATLRRITQAVTSVLPAATTTIDPANYDVGGVLTPVGGGVNTSTIQRVFLFATRNLSTQIVVEYGQVTYGSLANAVAAIGAGAFVQAPVTSDAALIGYIAVTRSATNLSDPTQATFVNAGKFPTP
jgi:hypothetical protein